MCLWLPFTSKYRPACTNYLIAPQEDLFRSNVTEAQGGIPLEIRYTVLDTSCNPVVGALIDIWHCKSTSSRSMILSQQMQNSHSFCNPSRTEPVCQLIHWVGLASSSSACLQNYAMHCRHVLICSVKCGSACQCTGCFVQTSSAVNANHNLIQIHC